MSLGNTLNGVPVYKYASFMKAMWNIKNLDIDIQISGLKHQ